MQDKLYDFRSLLNITNLSRTTVTTAINCGKLKCMRDGKRYFFKKLDVEQWLKAKTERVNSKAKLGLGNLEKE